MFKGKDISDEGNEYLTHWLLLLMLEIMFLIADSIFQVKLTRFLCTAMLVPFLLATCYSISWLISLTKIKPKKS